MLEEQHAEFQPYHAVEWVPRAERMHPLLVALLTSAERVFNKKGDQNLQPCKGVRCRFGTEANYCHCSCGEMHGGAVGRAGCPRKVGSMLEEQHADFPPYQAVEWVPNFSHTKRWSGCRELSGCIRCWWHR